MSNIFNSFIVKKPQTCNLNLGFENKLTGKAGELIPICCIETVPDDKFKVSINSLIRTAPLVHPIMQSMNVFFHFFFVPNRLIFDKWEDYIAGKEDISLPHIRESLGLFVDGSLADYLGYPTWKDSATAGRHSVTDDDCVSVLPARAYQLIYNEYFRDQNLIAEVPISTSGGVDNSSELWKLRRRAWHKDYFTSALPDPQMGMPVPVPIGNGRVVYTPNNTADTVYNSKNPDGIVGLSQNGTQLTDENENGTKVSIDNSNKLSVEVKSPSVADVRNAFKLQQFLERQARTGSRYIEMLQAFFGVRSSDARLQRPEYLGGVKNPIIISEVQSTSTSDSEPLGHLGGNGTSLNSNFAFSRRFEEHGFIIGIMSIMPKASYFQGLPRKFTRKYRTDFFWPDFQNIGEQEIKSKEIYFYGNSVEDNKSFGYAPRYAEYKYTPNEVHGEFRNSLLNWHLGRKFDNVPKLNSSFIEYDNANIDRALCVSSDIAHPFYCQLYLDIKANRPMTKYDEPHI